MTTYDRMADGYQPAWDIDLAVGKQGEMWVHHVIDAIQRGASIEVKTDEAATKWGRVYLEGRCLYGSQYRPSGLAATSAELWATVLAGDVVVIAPTWRYRGAARRAQGNPFLRRELTKGSHPTKGVVIPLQDLLRWLMDAETPEDPARVTGGAV